jgi:predicted Zn-dependent peptidase
MEFFKYENLKICIFPHNSNFTFASLNVNIGSKDEQKGENGLAHFYEHMIFKGSTKMKHPIERLYEHGCYMNANTIFEKTEYYIHGPSYATKLIVQVLLNLFFYPKFPESAIKNEKLVVQHEFRLNKNLPENILFENSIRLLYKTVDPSFMSFPIGKLEDIKHFSKKSLKEFSNKIKEKGNVHIFIMGGFSVKSVQEYIESTLRAKLEKVNPNRISAENKSLDIPFSLESSTEEFLENNLVFDRRNYMRMVHTNLLFRFTNNINENIHIMELIEILLSNTHESRLFKLLRNKYGYTYFQNLKIFSFTSHGYVRIHFGTSSKNLEKSIFIILEELFKICRDGFSEKELKQAKRILIHRCQIQNDSFVEYANFLQNQWSIDKPILTLPKLTQKYQKITLEEIQNVFKTVFCPLSKLYISCVGDNLTKFRKHKLFILLNSKF